MSKCPYRIMEALGKVKETSRNQQNTQLYIASCFTRLFRVLNIRPSF